MKKISLILILLITAPLYSYSKEITISQNAMKNYGIETVVVNKKVITLPRTALVVSRDDYYIYLKNGSAFEELQIYPTSITKDKVVFKLDKDAKREIVTKGSPYLRLVFLNDTDSAESE